MRGFRILLRIFCSYFIFSLVRGDIEEVGDRFCVFMTERGVESVSFEVSFSLDVLLWRACFFVVLVSLG